MHRQRHAVGQVGVHRLAPVAPDQQQDVARTVVQHLGGLAVKGAQVGVVEVGRGGQRLHRALGARQFAVDGLGQGARDVERGALDAGAFALVGIQERSDGGHGGRHHARGQQHRQPLADGGRTPHQVAQAHGKREDDRD